MKIHKRLTEHKSFFENEDDMKELKTIFANATKKYESLSSTHNDDIKNILKITVTKYINSLPKEIKQTIDLKPTFDSFNDPDKTFRSSTDELEIRIMRKKNGKIRVQWLNHNREHIMPKTKLIEEKKLSSTIIDILKSVYDRLV